MAQHYYGERPYHFGRSRGHPSSKTPSRLEIRGRGMRKRRARRAKTGRGRTPRVGRRARRETTAGRRRRRRRSSARRFLDISPRNRRLSLPRPRRPPSRRGRKGGRPGRPGRPSVGSPARPGRTYCSRRPSAPRRPQQRQPLPPPTQSTDGSPGSPSLLHRPRHRSPTSGTGPEKKRLPRTQKGKWRAQRRSISSLPRSRRGRCRCRSSGAGEPSSGPSPGAEYFRTLRTISACARFYFRRSWRNRTPQ